MQLINLTPRTLSFYSADGITDIPPSGELARVDFRVERVAEAGGVPVLKDVYGAVSGVPAPRVGVAYLVSSLVLTGLRRQGSDRVDVLAPATGPNDGVVRCSAGKILGVTQLKLL